jgi:hypothetical protein
LSRTLGKQRLGIPVSLDELLWRFLRDLGQGGLACIPFRSHRYSRLPVNLPRPNGANARFFHGFRPSHDNWPAAYRVSVLARFAAWNIGTAALCLKSLPEHFGPLCLIHATGVMDSGPDSRIDRH